MAEQRQNTLQWKITERGVPSAHVPRKKMHLQPPKTGVPANVQKLYRPTTRRPGSNGRRQKHQKKKEYDSQRKGWMQNARPKLPLISASRRNIQPRQRRIFTPANISVELAMLVSGQLRDALQRTTPAPAAARQEKATPANQRNAGRRRVSSGSSSGYIDGARWKEKEGAALIAISPIAQHQLSRCRSQKQKINTEQQNDHDRSPSPRLHLRPRVARGATSVRPGNDVEHQRLNNRSSSPSIDFPVRAKTR